VTEVPKIIIRQPSSCNNRSRKILTLSDLVKGCVVEKGKVLKDVTVTRAKTLNKAHIWSPEMKALHSIIQNLMESKSEIRKKYANDLSGSFQAFSKPKQVESGENETIESAQLCESIGNTERELDEVYMGLHKTFENIQSKGIKWLQKGGMWPCITTITILETLRSTTGLKFSYGMRERIIEYALSITKLQRLLRIQDAYQNCDRKKLTDEHFNSGHTNWNPRDRPDWLLLEVDANLLIRASQVDVANATICPESGSNAVLQMNMGQG